MLFLFCLPPPTPWQHRGGEPTLYSGFPPIFGTFLLQFMPNGLSPSLCITWNTSAPSLCTSPRSECY